MFDDWAYREHVHAPAPARPRAPSLVQTVASHKDADQWAVPKASVRARAGTLPKQKTTTLAEKPGHIDLPLLPADAARLKAWESWMGPEHSLDEFKVADCPYTLATSQAKAVLEQSRLASSFTGQLSSETSDLLAQLDSLRSGLDGITTAIVEMRVTSDGGIHRQELLDQLHADIGNNLAVYNNLEETTRQLNKPGTRLVAKPAEFAALLGRLDDGLTYCREHPEFKDMDLYELRHSQCLARALQLAQDYLISHFRKVAAAIKAKLGQGSAGSAAGALLYTKFVSETEVVKPILLLLRERKDPELLAAFAEVERQYFAVRLQLIGPETTKALQPLAPPGPPDLLATVRSVLVTYAELIEREQQVYESVFGPADGGVQLWLVDLCDPLYDALRRYIIRESDLSRLGEMMMTLQAQADGPKQLFDPIYRDVQSRLVFRADQVVESLAKHVPGGKEFSQGTYPPLEQALTLLEQVYQLMSPQVFSELVHRCVHQCLESLVRAKASATARLGDLEGALWHIQQLVILQTRIVEYDVENTVQYDVDFSGLQTLLDMIRSSRTQAPSLRDFIAAAWTSLPRVAEYMLDAMEELYSSLRASVQVFTTHSVQAMMVPLQESRDAHEAAHKFREAVTTQLQRVAGLATETVTDRKVVDALMDSVQELLVKDYSVYYDELVTISRDDIDDIMDSETFASWLNDQVRRALEPRL